MSRLFLYFTVLFFLSGCGTRLERSINSVVEWDKKHALSQADDTFDIASRVDRSWKLDLSNMGLPAVPDICRLLNLQDLQKITTIDLSDNYIQEVNGLNCLPNLRELDLSGNDIDSLVWFPIMANLKKLNLARNALKDLKGIELLVWIIELQLWENFLEDLEWLQYLKDLQKLWVELNKLKDLDVLQYIDTLKEVNAKYNELKGDIQEMLDKIPDIEV